MLTFRGIRSQTGNSGGMKNGIRKKKRWETGLEEYFWGIDKPRRMERKSERQDERLRAGRGSEKLKKNKKPFK